MAAILSALEPVQTAVYGALNVASFLALSPGGLYDHVPQATAYPYTVISVRERPLGRLDRRDKEVFLELSVFSQYEGLREAQRILAKALALLQPETGTRLTIAGFTQSSIEYEDTSELGPIEIGGIPTQHLVGRFRVLVEEA